MTAEEVIQTLGLVPLPGEGGFFRETYRSRGRLAAPSLPEGFLASGPDSPTVSRAFATAIFYFLTASTYSAMHRLRADEIYHFYRGDPVELFLWDEQSAPRRVVLGSRWERGEVPQRVVSSGVWQGSRLVSGGEWALLGTTVSPGFEFVDCQLMDRRTLEGDGSDPRAAAILDSLLAR